MRNPNQIRAWTIRMLVIALIQGATLVAYAQSEITIDITDYRPLAAAVTALEAETGVAINYEDVPYENEADLEDFTTAQQRRDYPGFRLYGPRKGSVKATIRTGGSRSDGENVMDVHALIRSYRNNGLPSDFRVEQANGMLYVVPTVVLGANGAQRNISSPMTTLITIPYGERLAIDAIAEILNAASKTAGLRIDVGDVPLVAGASIAAFGSSNEPARDVMAKLLAKVISAPASYRMLFDPKDKAYMFNVQVATPAGKPPSQNTTLPAAPASPSDSRWFDKSTR